MKKLLSVLIVLKASCGFSQTYPPAAGSPGSTAIPKESPLFVAWATGIEVERGFLNKSNPDFSINGNAKASAGAPSDAIGFPDGNTVSLGDGGAAVATFDTPITDGPGFDFAVFENGGASYLELAFVEVSSDGEHFFRFPNHSQTQTTTQIGSFGTPSADYLNNIAGKYAGLYGTPFDLSEIPEHALLDKNTITHVKVVDVVGSINPDFASYDSVGNAVNDSFPTPFASGGFDLQAIGILNQLNLGVGTVDQNEALYLYPNPAKSVFYIHSKTAVSVNLYDISGRLVLSKINNKGEGISISNLVPGLYQVQIWTENRTQIVPLLVQ